MYHDYVTTTILQLVDTLQFKQDLFFVDKNKLHFSFVESTKYVSN